MIKHKKLSKFKLGNLEVSRDFDFAPEYVKAMYLMLQQNEPINYVICSGNSIKLKEIVYYILDKLDISRNSFSEDEVLTRPAEIMDIYGDNSKAKDELGCRYEMSFFEAIDQLIEEEELYLITTKSI